MVCDLFKQIFRVFLRVVGPRRLDTLIFFVTGRCNSRCPNCFYWRRLNQTADLSLKEIEKMVQTIPKFNNLLLSGGEPFLRNDLPEIVTLFKKYCQIKSLSIPTNGLLVERIFKTTQQILEKNQNIDSIYLNISLDGL